MERIITGSCCFFAEYPGFCSKDIDEIEFVDKNPSSSFERIVKGTNKDVFYLKKTTKENYIKYFLNRDSGMTIAFFITPRVAEILGLTIEDLKLVAPLREKLKDDPRHEYLGIIYDYYIENNNFTLTNTQRQMAYNNYLAARR